MIIGDSEAAISAATALWTCFTGKIKIVPTSPFGMFQNQDVLIWKIGKIEKNELYFVENDFF